MPNVGLVGLLFCLACSTNTVHEALEAELDAASGHSYYINTAGSGGGAHEPRILASKGLAQCQATLCCLSSFPLFLVWADRQAD